MSSKFDRRGFLIGGAALGCSAAASPFVTPVAMAAAPWDTRLVVVILRGAMDGLAALPPLGDPGLALLRPHLSQDAGNALTGFFGLHPALEPLRPLWQSGELSFVPAVSTPYRDGRSHFDGQDVLEAGTAGVVSNMETAVFVSNRFDSQSRCDLTRRLRGPRRRPRPRRTAPGPMACARPAECRGPRRSAGSASPSGPRPWRPRAVRSLVVLSAC